MTICIAAIAREEEGEYIVFATDHMVATALGNFEHPIQKYKKINDTTVAMLAGNPLFFDELVKVEKPNASYEEQKEAIYENFKNKRKDVIQKELLDPLGVKYDEIIPETVRSPQINEVMLRIIEEITKFNLNTSILLVGFDKNKEAQITQISQENISDFRMFNFHAIGSGNMQAANTLLFQKHDRTERLKSTIYNVYKAKRNAEVLEGVGKDTDLFILGNERGCQCLNKYLTLLNEIYESEVSEAKLNPKLDQIKIKENLQCI
jgi:hypothetical protein